MQEDEREEERHSYKTCHVHSTWVSAMGFVHAWQCLALLMIELFSILSPENAGLSYNLVFDLSTAAHPIHVMGAKSTKIENTATSN